MVADAAVQAILNQDLFPFSEEKAGEIKVGAQEYMYVTSRHASCFVAAPVS